MVNIEERLTKELDITLKQVQNVIKLLDETLCKKMGYICRYYASNIMCQLPDFSFYVAFVSGWLEASTNYICIESFLKG